MESQESTRLNLGRDYGWVNAISRFNLPIGAFLEMKNVQGSVVPGEIRTRQGTQPADELTGTPGSYDLISLAPYEGPLGPTAITLDSNGALKARRDSGSVSLATGVDATVPMRFCVTRFGDVICVNGLERGRIWHGSTTTAKNLGVDPPTAAIADGDAALDSGGGLSAGDYLVAYRFVDRSAYLKEPVYSELSPTLKRTATDGQELNYDLTGFRTPPSRGTHVQIWRTTVGESSVFYLVNEQPITGTVYVDQFTDTQLIDAAAADPDNRLILRGPFGVVARRQTPPPKTKGAVVQFQDRYFYGGDVPYDTGTVSTTSTDATLTGSGTAWTSAFVGRYVYIDGASQPYEIASVTNGTSLEFTVAAAESLSGKSYAIRPAPSERNQVYYSAPDEPESVAVTFAIRPQAVQGDDDEITALRPFKSVLYLFKERHAYAFSYSREPAYDGRAQYAFARGCLNQACCDEYEGVLYVMDRLGCYAVSGGSQAEPISQSIQTIFRDGTIDFDKAKWFHVSVDPVEKIARFFVAYAGDSATRPTRALCYHVEQQTWWREDYVHPWAGAIRLTIDGEVKTVVGGASDRLYYLATGELDGVDSETSGTATAGTSSTLTDSGASFGSSSELVGASVAIYGGTGFGQVRRIASHTGTALTVTPNWTTTPDTTSQYLVGGVPYEMKAAYQPIVDQARKETENTSLHLVVEPIDSDRPVHVREFWDFDESAETRGSTGKDPTGFSRWTAGETDKLVSIHKTARVTGTNRGQFTLYDYRRNTGTREQGKKVVAVEIEGVKGDEAIYVHEIGLSGAGAAKGAS